MVRFGIPQPTDLQRNTAERLENGIKLLQPLQRALFQTTLRGLWASAQLERLDEVQTGMDGLNAALRGLDSLRLPRSVPYTLEGGYSRDQLAHIQGDAENQAKEIESALTSTEAEVNEPIRGRRLGLAILQTVMPKYNLTQHSFGRHGSYSQSLPSPVVEGTVYGLTHDLPEVDAHYLLQRRGMTPEQVAQVPSLIVRRDRTVFRQELTVTDVYVPMVAIDTQTGQWIPTSRLIGTTVPSGIRKWPADSTVPTPKRSYDDPTYPMLAGKALKQL